MPGGLEITKAAIDGFAKIQRRMLLAREENAVKTYADLKEDYLSLKALLEGGQCRLFVMEDADFRIKAVSEWGWRSIERNKN